MATKIQDGHQNSRWPPKSQDGCQILRRLPKLKMANKIQDGHQISRWPPNFKMTAKFQDGLRISRWPPTGQPEFKMVTEIKKRLLNFKTGTKIYDGHQI